MNKHKEGAPNSQKEEKQIKKDCEKDLKEKIMEKLREKPVGENIEDIKKFQSK